MYFQIPIVPLLKNKKNCWRNRAGSGFIATDYRCPVLLAQYYRRA